MSNLFISELSRFFSVNYKKILYRHTNNIFLRKSNLLTLITNFLKIFNTPKIILHFQWVIEKIITFTCMLITNLNEPLNIKNCPLLNNFSDSLKSATLQDNFVTWIIFLKTIPCKEWTYRNRIFQGISSTSISRGWGIFLVKFSYSIQELILFLCTKSGSLVCQIIPGKHFWKPLHVHCCHFQFPILNLSYNSG